MSRLEKTGIGHLAEGVIAQAQATDKKGRDKRPFFAAKTVIILNQSNSQW